MALRIAIVGPGRVGTAFAGRLRARGATVLGYVGRDAARTAACAAELAAVASPDPAAPAPRVLGFGDLGRAHVVVFAVGDAHLKDAVAAAARSAGRPCSLWLHTSGRFDLDVFEPAAGLGLRFGSLHPLAPFSGADPDAMRGAPALLAGAPNALRLLRRLCALLDLDPIVAGDQDRALYHAACALLANGTTALFGLGVEALVAAGGLEPENATKIAAALAHAAVNGSARHGAGPALSGPVRRGDAVTVAAHVDALARHSVAALPSYRALMHAALALAVGQGLGADAALRVAAALDAPQP